jgi:hypothetical protein
VTIGAHRQHRVWGLTIRVFYGLRRLLAVTTLSAIAIVLGFALIVAVAARFGPDCQSPQRSIVIGHVVMAGCLPRTSR